MPSIDFTVGAFIVCAARLLLIRHHKLNTWLPPGGHVDPGEDPETALLRELKEEVDLPVVLVGRREEIDDPRSKSLIVPRFMDLHPITEDHRHVGLFYLARTDTAQVGGEYASDCGWFIDGDLDALDMWPATRHYARIALRELTRA